MAQAEVQPQAPILLKPLEIALASPPAENQIAPVAPPTSAPLAPIAAKPATKAKVAGSDSGPVATTASKPAAVPQSATPLQALAVKAPDAEADHTEPHAEAAAPAKAAPAAPSTDQPATPQPAIQNPALAAQAPSLPRAEPQTVSRLAAQIVRKIDGKSSRFDISLDPIGLGRVNVRVEIGASGQVTAALRFDNPHAAAELRGRADELRQALQQAGFDVSKSGLSFSQGGQGQAGQNFAGGAPKARAGWASGSGADDALTPISNTSSSRRAALGGVDVRI